MFIKVCHHYVKEKQEKIPQPKKSPKENKHSEKHFYWWKQTAVFSLGINV